MAIDPSVIGKELPPAELLVERGRLRLFCRAIGETDPVYFDVATARRAGHPDLPVPPTFFTAVAHERPDPFDWLAELGVGLAEVLHGEQEFTYHAMAYAGDRLVMRSRISDAYSKKGGALEFIVRRSTVVRLDGRAIADLRDTIVVRNPEPAR